MSNRDYVHSILVKGLIENTQIGSFGFSKHDILGWGQIIDPKLKDGGTVGRMISKLVTDGYIRKMNPGKKTIFFERIK